MEKQLIKKRRPKGDGSVQKLSGGRYKVQITVGYDCEGRQKRRSFTSQSQKEALSMLNKFKLEEQVVKNKMNVLNFEALAQRWLTLKKVTAKKTSYQYYINACNNHIIPAIGAFPLQKLSLVMINDYIAGKISEGIAASTVIRHRAIIRSILDLACNEGVLAKNVAIGSMPVSSRKFDTQILSVAQMKKLLSVAREILYRKGNHYKYIYHIVLLALATGARRGEILALKWNCIDFDNNKIIIKNNLVEVSGGLYVDSPKTESSRRIIAVKPEILTILKKDLGPTEGNVFLFHTRTGKPLAPSSVGKYYRRLLKEAGIPGIRFHDLRHTHATHLVADGINIKLVSRRIGHKDIKTTLALYTHVLPEQDIDAAEKMGSWLIN